ncbi:hypothetical protein NPIL_441261 [Nephila pilipes]|uniref:Uncharacterized protein n=1 Tax=Nephila pilipes TaxID=299642 RepID=A0A8X6TUB1_NEPPI|nr:hypothetical protein NPIL_441261 [Nephila pilipes]
MSQSNHFNTEDDVTGKKQRLEAGRLRVRAPGSPLPKTILRNNGSRGVQNIVGPQSKSHINLSLPHKVSENFVPL